MQNALNGTANDVTQYIQATTVRHTHSDGTNTIINCTINDRLDTRNKRFTTLKTKALLVWILRCNKSLKRVRPCKTVENAALLVTRVRVRRRHLDALTQPVTHVSIGNMNILVANRTSIDTLASLNNLADRKLLDTVSDKVGQQARAKLHLLVEIRFRPTVETRVHFLGHVALAF